MSALIKVQGLFGGYDNETVLRDISFEIQRGEFLGIIGPNGSGKSTLLRLMSRSLVPQKGRILFEDQDIAKAGLKSLYRRMAFVSQDTLISFSFSAWEIVLMGRIPHLHRFQLESKKDFAIAEEALRRTDSLKLKDKEIHRLSAGERQRVIMAKALAQEPVLLFLDEPTSHLDIGHQIQILDLLKKLNQETHLTIILVLHDLNLAGEYCDRLILLHEGKVFKDGKPQDVLTYQTIEAVYQTVVVVNPNPVTSRPHIMLIPREQCRRK